MRKFLISASLIAAAAVSAPAAAQYGGNGRGYDGQNIQRELSQIVDRIHQGEDRNRISRKEERRLLRQADQIDRLFDRYRRNGIDPREQRELQNRLQNLRQQLRFERQDGNNHRR